MKAMERKKKKKKKTVLTPQHTHTNTDAKNTPPNTRWCFWNLFPCFFFFMTKEKKKKDNSQRPRILHTWVRSHTTAAAFMERRVSSET